ncbi:cytosine deaminase, partial [Aerococcus sp. UMB8623]|nr:cytosine deaminase [Aerococcus sp. UMB8623]
ELKNIEAMLEVRDELKDKVTIQVVAFPQEGVFAYKDGNGQGLELMEEALKMGADVLGGIPHFEWSRELGEKSIHKIVELAMKY